MGKVGWITIAMALLLPGLAGANFECPRCDDVTGPLGVGAVVELALSTLLQKGLGILLFGGLAVAALPWTIAALAVAVMNLPSKLRIG
ncbi:MAG TPA: hypothetical protein VEK15_17400 [Vicinamibacteria bacterium]|nr:hypothetical protein [Vicinamibacteria bacterium]